MFLLMNLETDVIKQQSDRLDYLHNGCRSANIVYFTSCTRQACQSEKHTQTHRYWSACNLLSQAWRIHQSDQWETWTLRCHVHPNWVFLHKRVSFLHLSSHIGCLMFTHQLIDCRSCRLTGCWYSDAQWCTFTPKVKDYIYCNCFYSRV